MPRRARRYSSLLACCLMVAALGEPARADPPPSTKELQDRVRELGDQLEQLTEQYNGLKVKLARARRASKVAADNADRRARDLEGLRETVGRLATTTYMTGGLDSSLAFALSGDPQELLDRTSALSYLNTQNGTQVTRVLAAMQAARRSRKAADDRADQVLALQDGLERKRTDVAKVYDRVRGQLIERDPSSITRIPVTGTGKAADALRYAMAQLGKPYVWGADGPDSFDCSGLTMWAYGKVGINLPHFTGSQWNAGVHVTRDRLQPGDLVFFYSDLHHMGMYVGDGKMIHAPQTGDVVKISPIDDRPWAGGVRVA